MIINLSLDLPNGFFKVIINLTLDLQNDFFKMIINLTLDLQNELIWFKSDHKSLFMSPFISKRTDATQGICHIRQGFDKLICQGIEHSVT